MEPDQNITPAPNAASPLSPRKALIVVLILASAVIGALGGYLARESSYRNLQNQVTQLTNQVAELQKNTTTTTTVSTKPPAQETRAIYKYGINARVPTALGKISESEAVIPLGATGKYTVKSTLFEAKDYPNMSILLSTDAIVYENFIRTGTQAITPDPNTLTPGTPLMVNGVSFCAALGSSTSCVYNADENTATFEKVYTDKDNNPYTIHGSARFFPIKADSIGQSAAILITRVTSDNPELIEWAKQIALGAKK